jgi:F0F1-type ATP synthase membrane subunit b/b'
MSKDHSSFQDLEKQLAKDALKEALKNLHGEITKDIEKNKATFSQEIQKTLSAFKSDLEETISKELDKKISAHLKNNFLDISTKVTSSFYESYSPLLKRAEEDLTRLHRQGESTLNSWKVMMLQYASLWTKPFMIAFFAAAFAGMVIFFVCTYLLWGKYTQEIQNYEKRLASNENMLLWYFEKYKERPEALKKGNQGSISGPKTQALSKKKRNE